MRQCDTSSLSVADAEACQAENYEGASIFWMRRMAALGGEEATMAHWQVKRDGTLRGIVEVIEHDS